MSSRSRWIVVILATIGLGFASWSAWVHYRLLTDPAYISPCDMGSRFSCSPLYLSNYGSIKGVPVALFGVLWFGLVGLIAWFSTPVARDASTPRPGGAYLFAISTIGLAVVMYLGYTSWTVFKTFCVLCLGTYAAVAGIFITTGVSSPMSVSQLTGRFATDLGAAIRRPLVLLLTLGLLGGTGYAASVFPREGQVQADQQDLQISAEQKQAFAEAWAQQPRTDIGVPADGAKVLVVKFQDYQCPGCAATHAWYKPVLAKYEKSNPGAVKLVLKDWPWNAKCNANLTPGAPGVPEHLGTCEGAAAVRMARERGGHDKEVEMQDWLFTNLTAGPALVKAAAERILGVTDFDTQYAKQLPEIRKDAALGGTLHIQGTPTLFINGVRIEQVMPGAYFDLAIELELKRSGK